MTNPTETPSQPELQSPANPPKRLVQKLLWALLPFVALIWLFAKGLGNNPQALPSTQIGKPVPAFTLPDLEGKALSNADLPQGAYLLNVWGSWCAACYEEHPFLMQLSQEIPIIGINWGADNPNEIHDAQAMLAKFGNPYQKIAHDGTGKMITDLGVYGAPETFLVNANGRIIERHAGALTQALWETQLKPKLGGKE